MTRVKIGYHWCFQSVRQEGLTGKKTAWAGRGLVRKKGGLYFRPARCLEGNGGSEGSDCAVGWDFPGVKWREGAGALWRASACATDDRVAGGHIVARLGCEGPSIGDRQLARPCAPRSVGDGGVRIWT